MILTCGLMLSVGLASAAPSSGKSGVDYIDPLIGTEGAGSQYGGMWPGVGQPFASLQWVGMTRLTEVGRTSYNFSDTTLLGFIGTRQPAIWMGDYGQVSIAPRTGAVDVDFRTRGLPFSHSNEVARPWLYRVTAGTPEQGQVTTEMTGTERAGIFRIAFPKGQAAHVVVDASRDYASGVSDQRPADGWIKIGEDGRTVEGWNKDRLDGQHAYDLPHFKGYFVIVFSRPYTTFGTYAGNGKVVAKGAYQFVATQAEARTAQANRVGGYVCFAASEEPLLVRVGTSMISLEQARANLAREIPEWDFDAVVAQTRQAWERQFARLAIETPDEGIKTIFYTGLYHALLYPRVFSEYGRYYSAFDDQVHSGVSYTSYSMWDTYRAEHALLTLVASERVDDMMTALLQMYQEGGWLPMWPNPSYTGIMSGGPAEMILAEAWSKGFRGFDVKLAYEAVKKNATVPQTEDETRDWRDRGNFGKYPETRGGLSWYQTLGYVACDKVKESVSRTQDFALNDTAAAILAQATGHAEDAAFFTARSKSYTNVWERESKLFLPRKADGTFTKAQDGHDYTECSAQTSLWCVPHDPLGVAALLGGKEAFEARLDDYFQNLFFKPERGNRSIQGNEPSHHTAYLYNAIGKQWKSAAQVREIARRSYSTDKKGFDGNEDCGQMSAWYILSALGFYPLHPATDVYEIGSPLVDKAVLKIGAPYAPATFTVVAKNQAPTNVYVQSASLNGKRLAEPRIRQKDIVAGGTLEFVMGDKPNPAAFGTN
jgi:predicted alpha-1,2-mannosidase